MSDHSTLLLALLDAGTPRDLVDRVAAALKAKAPRERSEVQEPIEFAAFWSAYPKRAGTNPRKPALAAYVKALKSGVDPREVYDGMRAYTMQLMDSGKYGTEYVKQAASWLNSEGWKDDYSARPKVSRASRFDVLAEDLRSGREILPQSPAIGFRACEIESRDRRGQGGDFGGLFGS